MLANHFGSFTLCSVAPGSTTNIFWRELLEIVCMRTLTLSSLDLQMFFEPDLESGNPEVWPD